MPKCGDIAIIKSVYTIDNKVRQNSQITKLVEKPLFSPNLRSICHHHKGYVLRPTYKNLSDAYYTNIGHLTVPYKGKHPQQSPVKNIFLISKRGTGTRI